MHQLAPGDAERRSVADHDPGLFDGNGSLPAKLGQAAADRLDRKAEIIGHVGGGWGSHRRQPVALPASCGAVKVGTDIA